MNGRLALSLGVTVLPIAALPIVLFFGGMVGTAVEAQMDRAGGDWSQEFKSDLLYLQGSSKDKALSRTGVSRGRFERSIASLSQSDRLLDLAQRGEEPEFSQSVMDQQEILSQFAGQLRKNEKVDDIQVYSAAYAASDLELKNSYLKVQDAGDAGTGLVRVTVNTVTPEKEPVPGCEVWYVPLAWARDRQRWKRFDELSTPTKKKLPVGRYLMWTQKGEREGARRPVSPGDDNRDSKDVDLFAPSGS